MIVNCSKVANQADFLLLQCASDFCICVSSFSVEVEIILKQFFWVEFVLLLQGQVLSSSAQEAAEARWEHCCIKAVEMH